jgi:hypothetical protein
MTWTGAAERPAKWEWGVLALLVLLAVVFGGLVEMRSAFLTRRMTDLPCYLRGAWAVRSGTDLYQITDDNNWHYNYPPLLAILLVPLADPPAGADRAGTMPYPVTVALWYLFSVCCIAVASHSLAGALEQHASAGKTVAQHRGSRCWWALRLIPVLACLPPLAHSLMRGQVNPLVLALFCGMIAALLRGRSMRAGLFLAGAACIKVYPLFLLLYPLWRRDGRFLAGAALGLALGLGLVPAVTLGPSRAVSYYAEYCRVTLMPGIGAGADRSRADELTKLRATDSQSLLAALHNGLHPNRYLRPEDASPTLRRIQLATCALMTLVTLLAAGWRRPLAGPALPVFFGALILVMLLTAPVCHLHYFSLTLPLIMGLLVYRWQRHRDISGGPAFIGLLTVNVIANTLPHLPVLEVLRDRCLTAYMALVLWGVAVVVLWRRPQAVATEKMPASAGYGVAA